MQKIECLNPATYPTERVEHGTPVKEMTGQELQQVIAIVDDEAPVLASLARLVRSRGYGVAPYALASEFLRSLEFSRPACLLLDLHMPLVSGFDVLAALRERSEPLPVIVVTGNAGPEVCAKVMSLGVVACLDKPVEAATLFDAVKRALAREKESG
jgi:FixJ family two-component response regulator